MLATAISWAVNEVLATATTKAFVAKEEKKKLDQLVAIAAEHDTPLS